MRAKSKTGAGRTMEGGVWTNDNAGWRPALPGGWGWGVAVAAVLVLGFWLRAAHYRGSYGHPDEAITVEVVGHMRQSGDWDTNWAKAPNLEAGLRYDQYNFSSHLLATFGFYRVVKLLPGMSGWRSENAGFWVYRFFSVLLAAVAVWQAMRLAERVAGRGAALGAGLLVAVTTLLVQDAHFARPEAFVTALTLAAVALSWPRERLRAVPVLVGGFVVGVLVACKISMLALAWLPLVPIVAGEGNAAARCRLAALALLAMVLGFVAGVPGVVTHPEVFVSGVKHLMTQYAGLHPPHSHMNGAAVADMMGAYFAATLGWPVLVGGAVGVGVLAWRRRWVELVLLAGPVVVFAGYFATKGVFFERNLSHVLPLFLILVAVGAMAVTEWVASKASAPAWAVGGLVFALLAAQPARVTWPLVVTEFSGEGAKQLAVFEETLRARHPGAAWKTTVLLNDGPFVELAEQLKAGRGPVLWRVTDYNDEWTAYCLTQFSARFAAKPVGEFAGVFSRQPTSTLLTYHRARERYFLVTGVR